MPQSHFTVQSENTFCDDQSIFHTGIRDASLIYRQLPQSNRSTLKFAHALSPIHLDSDTIYAYSCCPSPQEMCVKFARPVVLWASSSNTRVIGCHLPVLS